MIKLILRLVNSDIKVSANKRFVVADHFQKGVAGIYFVSETFQVWFGGRVEENIPTATLTSYQLTQNSFDGTIKAELGKGHETFLCWLFQKIQAQSDGREGELLVNGYANIWYIDGRVVCARWNAGYGWYVYVNESCTCTSGVVVAIACSPAILCLRPRRLWFKRKLDSVSFGHFNPRFAHANRGSIFFINNLGRVKRKSKIFYRHSLKARIFSAGFIFQIIEY